MTIASSGALMDALRVHHLLPADRITQLPQIIRGRSGDARSLARLLGQRGWLTIFQINQVLEGRGKDLVVGPYVVLDRLGQGGLSQVFKAKHTEHGWIVALKVIKPEALASPEGKRQFLHEMEAMARLDHPHVVQFIDVDQGGDTYYFAMEWVDGIDLGKHVSLSGPLPAHEACDYIRQAALGLQHAHERNLVHRDIKPVNLFLSHLKVRVKKQTAPGTREIIKKQPLIKILDWGLARLRSTHNQQDDEKTKTTPQGILGTADYVSPEQVTNHETVDIRGDIYSLGCTFYYLLTGQAPFPDGTLAQKILNHRKNKPAHLSTFRDDVPAEVIQTLERMLAKDPEERFHTPAAVAIALAPHSRAGTPTPPRVALLRSSQDVSAKDTQAGRDGLKDTGR